MRFLFTFIFALLAAMPSAQASFETGPANSVMRVPSTGGRPKYGQVDISNAAAVVNSLAIANGGTGQATATAGFNALAPATAKGGMLVGIGTNSYGNAAAGTDGTVWTADSAAGNGAAFEPVAVVIPQGYTNVGLVTSVGSSAMTIAFKQSDGATNCSSGSPCSAIFRNTTAATGGYSKVSITSSLSITIPSGATLGQVSGAASYVWVYLVNNSGTADICVSGVLPFDDMSLQSSTTISAGSTSGTTMYCNTGIATKPVRLLGRVLVTEATAGTWASNATEVAMWPTPRLNQTEPSTSVWQWQAGAPFGSPATSSVSWRNGKLLCSSIYFIVGTETASAAIVTVPSGLNMDVSNMQSTGKQGITTWFSDASAAAYGASSREGPVHVTASDSTNLYFSNSGLTNTIAQKAGNALNTNAGDGFHVTQFCVPILQWSAYGP